MTRFQPKERTTRLRVRRGVTACATVLLASFAVTTHAQEVEGNHVRLKDGSLIKGDILKLEGGALLLGTGFGQDVLVPWSEISELSSDKKLRIDLSDETVLQGTLRTGEDGKLRATIADSEGEIALPMTAVAAINVEPISYTGNLNFGGAVSDGNTRTKTATANAEFIARSKRQRLTLRGAWNYAQDQDGLTARNTRGSIKYDFFLTKKWYLFAGALFEGDEFQDLDLRTALSGGVGYQILEKGEAASDLLKRLAAYVEAGLAFFSENFDVGQDQEYISARWAMRADWDLVPDKLILFHSHEGYPGLEESDDLYIYSEQGIRLPIVAGLNATFQVNWRWDNTPSAGLQRSDTLYLATVGYTFSF